LQRALGTIADGHIGVGTLDALLQSGDHAAIINGMCDQRLVFLQSLKGGALWKTFGVGWNRRVADVRANGLAMARAAQVSVPMPEPRPSDVYAPVEAQPPIIVPAPPTPAEPLPLPPQPEPEPPPLMEAVPGSAKAPAPPPVESSRKDPVTMVTIGTMIISAITAATRAIGEFFDAIKPIVADPVFLTVMFAVVIGGGGYVVYKRRQKIKLGMG
jgi:hypothetical protein